LFGLFLVSHGASQKRFFFAIAHRDGGGSIYEINILSGARVDNAYPKLFFVLPLKPWPPQFSTLVNLSMLRTPSSLGQQTVSQITLHFAPVLFFLVEHRKTLYNL
jgi:hypothetical protein